jgi:RecJ-like exonuclease
MKSYGYNLFMSKTCPQCRGTGYITDRVAAVFTFGIGAAIDWLINQPENALTKEPCPKCDGTGELPTKRRDPNGSET